MSKLKEKYRTLDFIFRHEEKIFQVVEKIKRSEVSIFNDSHLRDPTAASALRNLITVSSVTVCGKVINAPEKWLKIISASYTAAKTKSTDVYEIAKRRYRNGEYFLTTCIKKFIAKSTYYRLLETFFKIAERESRKIFNDS